LTIYTQQRLSYSAALLEKEWTFEGRDQIDSLGHYSSHL